MQITPVPSVGGPASVQEPRPAASTTDINGQARLLNPRPAIDPAIGIVVTEYFNRAGDITEQYPTAKAVESYRLYGLHGVSDGASPEE